MKLTTYLLCATAGTAVAYPGMGNLMAELSKRAAAAPADPTIEMIGDLVQGATTPVGKEVKDCLLGNQACQNLTPKSYVAPKLYSLSCWQDTCCVWDYVQADLVKMFTNSDGTCNALARQAVRLGFHDAAAWSKTSGPGGADGSLVLSWDEINRSENKGMQEIRLKALGLLTKYALWGVGGADLVQFMHNVATVVCPLGPRVLTFVGRPNRFTSDPTGLIPDTHSPASVLIDLFQNKTINFKDLIALIGAHTTAQQFFVDPSKAGQPLDSTPGVWDVKFYSETLAASPPAGVFRLPSDQSLVSDPETHTGFTVFSNPTNGQQIWNAAYATAYVRLSLLGVNNINKLTDCTKVLPNPITSF
ncbi:peroxidase-2 [Coleophoma cylindrospora]|uniref:Peroxidase n=1 Tax=Coleophoma cylindrospora TaxID=1849047 RepID=A0A3D8S984_9HELO|nr:peroxidase-2 [Coleophoma cylindrospora]